MKCEKAHNESGPKPKNKEKHQMLSFKKLELENDSFFAERLHLLSKSVDNSFFVMCHTAGNKLICDQLLENMSNQNVALLTNVLNHENKQTNKKPTKQNLTFLVLTR